MNPNNANPLFAAETKTQIATRLLCDVYDRLRSERCIGPKLGLPFFEAKNIEKVVTRFPKELEVLLKLHENLVDKTHIRWVTAKLASWNILASISGEFIDSILTEKMRLNNLKCMLKREWEKEHPENKLQKFDFIIEYSLLKILLSVYKKHLNGKHDDLFFSKFYEDKFLQ